MASSKVKGGGSTRPRPTHDIISVQDLEDGHINICLYGEPGVGKSRLAGTSPNCLILAHDKSEVVSMKYSGSKADFRVVHDINDLLEAYEYLRHEGVQKYKWVWLDNASLFQEQNLDSIMEDVVAAKPHRDRYIPDKPEYLRNQNQLGLLMRNLTALPINFGWTAHVMRIDDEEDAEKWTLGPLLQGGRGAFSQKLAGYTNILAYCSVRTKKKEGKNVEEHVVRFHRSGHVAAKDRYDKLPALMVNPTIPQIEALINGGPSGQGKVQRDAQRSGRRPAGRSRAA